MRSPEGIFFRLVRFIAEHPSPFAWDQGMNFGGSTLLSGGPLLPYLLALLGKLLGVELATLYRDVAGVFLLLGTVSFYLLVRYLTRREFTAIAATIYFLSPPLIFLLVLPAEVRQIVDQVGFTPWHLLDFLVGGEGKHLASLAILPLTLLFFLHALRTNAYRYHLLAGLFFALGLLAKWGSWPIAVSFSLIFLFSELLLGHGVRKLRSSFSILLLTLGFVAFWANPHFLGSPAGAGESPIVFQHLVGIVPLLFVALPIVATLLFFLFDRRPGRQPVFIGAVGTALFLLLVVSWVVSRQAIFSDPLVFLSEFHLAESILVGVILTWFVRLLQRAGRRLEPRQTRVVVVATITLALGSLLALATTQIPVVHRALEPQPDITRTAEWEIGDRVRSLVESEENSRVLAGGSSAPWLALFASKGEIIGNVDSARRLNPQVSQALEVLETVNDPEQALSLLRALRITHLLVSGLDSQVADPGFDFPGVFARIPSLVPLSFEGGSTIYRFDGDVVPSAQAVEPTRLGSLPKRIDPAKGEDVEAYLEAFQSVPANTLETAWKSTNEFTVSGIAPEIKAVSIAVNDDSSWRAALAGQSLRLERDPFGFILLRLPVGATGALTFTSGPRTLDVVGFAVTALTIILAAFFGIPGLRRRLARRPVAPQPSVLIPPKAGFVEMMVESPKKLKERHEAAKQYYREVEDFDWVEATDNFQGLDTFFHRNREEFVVKLVERFGVGGKMLDAGCGTGVVLRHLPAGSIGLDINPRAIEKAKKNAPKAALVVSDIENIPFPDNFFSTVICTEVLDRLPNPERAIRELRRILTPGGVLIGTVPRENPMWRLRYLSSYNPEAVPWHKEYKRPEVEELLHSFEVLQLSPALSYMTWAFVGRKRSS